MSNAIQRSTAKRLEIGTSILVTVEGDQVTVATGRQGAEVATVEAVERSENPDPDRRGGYRLRTSRGDVPFVTGQAKIILASTADLRRAQRQGEERATAATEAAPTLAGVTGPRPTPATVAATAAPPAPRPRVRPGPARPAPARPAPSAAQVAAASRRRTSGRIPVALGPAAATNFRALARASQTPRARDFWLAQAAKAEPKAEPDEPPHRAEPEPPAPVAEDTPEQAPEAPPVAERRAPVPEVDPEPEAAEQAVLDETGRRWVVLPGVEDGRSWEGVADVENSALTILRAARKGLPPAVPLLLHDDVTALHGIDLGMVEAACREPERVDVDPSTGTKKYPVLKMWRGDVMVVVGFREPYAPKVIAAYISGLNLGDNRPARTGGGGGGSRKALGQPKTSLQLVKRLREAGALLVESADGRTHSVTFEGADLGKVSTEPNVARSVVESDYQRMRRRIEAIRTRKEKTG